MTGAPRDAQAARRWRTHATAGGWTLLVTALLLVPLPSVAPRYQPWLELPVDKLVHALFAGGQALLTARSLRLTWPPRRAALVAATFAFAWTAGLEVVQGAIGRDASPADAIADAIGALTGGWWAARRRLTEPAGVEAKDR